MFSIDQNCHSLWDVPAKLDALARAGHRAVHFIEDIDVAFTSIGSHADGGDSLSLARERYHHSGGADWGAALFYFEFLGRQPIDPRQWEPQTSMKTAALARQLGWSVEELFDRYSPSDNWQLIGPSYFSDREHHRVVGDLTVAETAEFVIQLFTKARADCLSAFPQTDSQRRLGEWFDAEEARVARLLEDRGAGRLVNLYEAWLSELFEDRVELRLTSSLFALPLDEARARLLEIFLTDYDAATAMYSQAIAETGVGLRPLDTKAGELPFFATLTRDGHMVRTGVYLNGDAIRVGERTFPLGPDRRLPQDALIAAGVKCLAGKALLLVIQARLGPQGQPLAVPYNGSLYMPAAHRLQAKLTEAGLLNGPLQPLMRVRFRLLDRLRGIGTLIRPPAYLAAALGKDELPARELGECWADLAHEAAARLEAFTDADARQRWQRDAMGDLAAEADVIDRRRRELARSDPKSAEIRQLSHRHKETQTRMLAGLLEQIARDTHVSQIDYWDSRGALLPWCIGLGGRELYDDLVANAGIYEEGPEPSE